MAVVNVKSQIITDLDATPVVKTNQLERGGKLRTAYGTAAFAASDATSVARVLRVASSARVESLYFANDDLGTGGTVDIGLHDISAVNAGAVVDADFFASALDTDTAAVVFTDRTYESGVITHTNAGKAIWEQLGLATDPKKEYDITVTRNTAQGTGAVSIKLVYAEGQ